MWYILFIVIGSASYINNIIWLFDNWHSLSWIYKAFEIFSVLMPPLGCILGFFHFL